ncbi:TVA4 protein, partial [Crypturellus soui]|nr:TVA4 protein [Crypturellus soui]
YASAVAAAKAQIQQEPSAETTEGQAINITCSHPNIQTNEYIQWYRQLPGQGPTFIASLHKGSKAVSEPVGTLLVGAERRSSVLQLSWPRRRDAAVYYCARGA